MNIADKAWQIDREIKNCEKEISRLIEIILDFIETGHDATEEEQVCFELNERLFDLRFERVSLPEVPPAIPHMRCA